MDVFKTLLLDTPASTGVTGALSYKGTWNAATNNPSLSDPPGGDTQGNYYVVSTAGTQFGISFDVNDWIISNGTAWQKVDNTDAVTSVFSRTGTVVASNGDYTASNITNVPAGNISAVTVQAALDELDADISSAQEVLTATITNAESTAITRGQVVYVFSATGNRISVKLASNAAESTSSKTFGVVSDASIAAGTTGLVTCVGTVTNLSIGTFTDGQTVYLGTAGAFTATKPVAPAHLVYVGFVERANAGNGELYVKIQNGYELDELHDVLITGTPAAGSLVIRDATNSLWKNATLTAGTNIAVTNADAAVTVGLTGTVAVANGGTGITSFGTGIATFLGTPTSANLAAALTDETGTGANVFATSPTLVTPILGTPTSGTLTNCTGTASGLTAGNVTTNANLTGDVTSVGNATTLTNAPVIAKVLTGYVSGAGTVAATDSILQAIQKLNGNDATNANLTGVITSSGNATSIASQTGTGTKFVVDTSPTLVTPNIGAATGTSLTTTGNISATNGSLNIAKTAASNNLNYLTSATGYGTYLDIGVLGSTAQLATSSAGDFSISTNGVAGSVFNLVRSGSVSGTLTLTGGNVTSVGNITAYYSDDRLKTKLGNIENALDKVCSLDGFYYEANETAQALGYKPVREVGLSAQSVQKVLPEVIAPAPIDSQYLTMHYERVVPLLVEAIKELRAEVASLKKCNC